MHNNYVSVLEYEYGYNQEYNNNIIHRLCTIYRVCGESKRNQGSKGGEGGGGGGGERGRKLLIQLCLTWS